MPVTLAQPAETTAPIAVRRKRWTRAECAALEATGVWDSSHLELIEGELIDKMGKNHPHSFVTSCLMHWLVGIFERVYVEATINVAPQDTPTSEPQPDVVVMKKGHGGFRPQQPKPEELALVVEVSDTTLDFDLRVKGPLYARAGIEEYWVVDLKARRIVVHRTPAGGEYQSIEAYSEDEGVAPLAAPEQVLAVRDILPS